jgi:RimJ/RimL family protein N-acetyltransferase
MTPDIRILHSADAASYFRLRRQSLLDSPLEFLASPEDDPASSEGAVREFLARGPESVVFGALAEDLVGILGFHRATQIKSAHKVNLWGMFVTPHWRGKGLGERLLHAAIAHAQTFDGVSTMRLSVSPSAVAARRLYERVGFKAWGTEPDAMRYQERLFPEHHMARPV